MARALYLTNPLIELASGGQPDTEPDPLVTMLGYQGLREIALDAPFDPTPLPDPTPVPQPPPVQRAGIDW